MKNQNQPAIQPVTGSPWRQRLYTVIFESDTPAGKAFDVALLWAILLSVFIVMLESVQSIRLRYGAWLRTAEWVFTALFTLEYLARVIAVRKPQRYVFSFLGIVDLLSVVPTYLSVVLVGSQYFIAFRTVRLLRVFRIFKLSRYLGEADILAKALRASRHKITVFLGAVLSIVIIAGTLMYLIEGPENGFTSIPTSIYWTIVTLTTVGYGDIAPQTALGKAVASFIMIVGYGIIAVPTGIVSAELAHARRNAPSVRVCPGCLLELHDEDAEFCKRCGTKLEEVDSP